MGRCLLFKIGVLEAVEAVAEDMLRELGLYARLATLEHLQQLPILGLALMDRVGLGLPELPLPFKHHGLPDARLWVVVLPFLVVPFGDELAAVLPAHCRCLAIIDSPPVAFLRGRTKAIRCGSDNH